MEKDVQRSRRKKRRNFVSSLALLFLSLLLTIPAFVVVYRYVPDVKIDLGQVIRLDHILTFLLILFVIRMLVSVFRKIVLGMLVATLIVLGINEVRDQYGFSSLYMDYMDMLTYVQDNPMKLPFLKGAKMTVRNANEIRESVDYKNPKVRDFAIKASQEYFSDPDLHRRYGPVIRYFSIFKIVNDWKYIPDPKGEEYYAKASESVDLMAGDCDDHAILISACIKAIGGEPRIVHTDRHLYPEVKVCHEKDFPEIINLIKRDLFYKESMGESIYFHRDDEGFIWLNFDYTGDYPGAPFMDTNVIGILEL
ncbi:MAG: hypothetical protein K9H84_08005 [Bacteroidales bacterium]|nr:hypothetical protein [Bacteroidales bacterium]